MKRSGLLHLTLAALLPWQMALNKEKWKKAGSLNSDEDKKVVIGRECDSTETLQLLEKNSNALRNKANHWGIAVKDEGKGYCGFELVSGGKIKRVNGDKSEKFLNAEMNGFFTKQNP